MVIVGASYKLPFLGLTLFEIWTTVIKLHSCSVTILAAVGMIAVTSKELAVFTTFTSHHAPPFCLARTTHGEAPNLYPWSSARTMYPSSRPISVRGAVSTGQASRH